MRNKKELKSLKLNLLTAKKHKVKDLEYIYIDKEQNVIATNGYSAIKTTLSEAMGINVVGFLDILLEYEKIYIHTDEFKKIANKALYSIEVLEVNEKELFLRFTEKSGDVIIKASLQKYDFFEKCLKSDFFKVISSEVDSIAFDFNLLNNFNDAINSRVSNGTNDATVLNFSSKVDKILIKNLSLKNTTFILLPVKLRGENY